MDVQFDRAAAYPAIARFPYSVSMHNDFPPTAFGAWGNRFAGRFQMVCAIACLRIDLIVRCSISVQPYVHFFVTPLRFDSFIISNHTES